MFIEIILINGRHADILTPAGRVDKFATADVDANVIDLVFGRPEEDQVSVEQVVLSHRITGFILIA